MKAQDIMTRNPACVTPESNVQEAARLMKDEDVGVIPVVESRGSSRLVGVITDRDIAMRIVGEGRDAKTAVREVMSTRLTTAKPDDDLELVMERMGEEQIRRVPIVDDRGALVGIIAQADLVLSKADDEKTERTIEEISEPDGTRPSKESSF